MPGIRQQRSPAPATGRTRRLARRQRPTTSVSARRARARPGGTASSTPTRGSAVRPTTPKEVHFFDGLWERGLERRRTSSATTPSSRGPTGHLCGEWTPGYMLDVWTPAPAAAGGPRGPPAGAAARPRRALPLRTHAGREPLHASAPRLGPQPTPPSTAASTPTSCCACGRLPARAGAGAAVRAVRGRPARPSCDRTYEFIGLEPEIPAGLDAGRPRQRVARPQGHAQRLAGGPAGAPLRAGERAAGGARCPTSTSSLWKAPR